MIQPGRATIEHAKVRRLIEQCGGSPACLMRELADEPIDQRSLLISFPGAMSERSLQGITWDEFFAAFERHQLALCYGEAEDDAETPIWLADRRSVLID